MTGEISINEEEQANRGLSVKGSKCKRERGRRGCTCSASPSSTCRTQSKRSCGEERIDTDMKFTTHHEG